LGEKLAILAMDAIDLERDKYLKRSDTACLNVVSHISPIGWDNIVLYGEYVLNLNLIK
jgi:hypothetical protein